VEGPAAPLHVRWLGRVGYRDAHALQTGLHDESPDDHLLLLEHPHVYTLGLRADPAHVLVPPASVGADLVRTNRGGDVTYHGPGQLVGYPILSVPGIGGGGLPDTAAYVRSVEQLVIDTLADLGVEAARLDGYPGVWVGVGTADPRKICAIGVRLTRGRSMHGFALNVDPDLAMFDHIVPCGIADKAVTSLAAEGVDVSMRQVVDPLVTRAVARWGAGGSDRHDVVWHERPSDLAPFSRGSGPGQVPGRPTRGREPAPDRSAATTSVPASASATTATAASTAAPTTVPGHAHDTGSGTSVRLLGRLAEAGVHGGVAIDDRKPEWMRAPLKLGPDVMRLKQTMRGLDLVTVCEEAGCPNLSDCWSDGTATFMICGERCTRACGFCLVDTRRPAPLDAGEPDRVATAVERMGLSFAVVTMVARDDLADGGAAHVAATIEAIRRRTPHVGVEVLISDLRGDAADLQVVLDARPDVVNHNIETVARLQRAARPSAGYARSLALLARAKAAGQTTKSSIIVGLGETFDEVVATMVDLRGVGVDIVTIGQYLRPTTHHLPVARWWTPDEFADLKRIGEDDLGLGHVESSPLTRSSYHARQAAESVVRAQTTPVRIGGGAGS
jgi:lipoic acid synthetase